MRYVSKIYVMDVLDHVVVSGYVRDAETLDIPQADPYEFTLQWPGYGEPEPHLWLARALTPTLDTWRHHQGRPGLGGLLAGGRHTISETGDRR